jgi:hypothetical protein
MSILDLGTAPSKSPFGRNHVKRLLGFGVLVAIVGIGSSFASTLTINSNQAIEFGQGVQQSVFCGGENGSITVTPQSQFTNGEVGTFGLSTIAISSIPENCSDRNFIIKIYDANSSTPLNIAAREGNTPAALELINVWWTDGCHSEGACRVREYALDDGYAIGSSARDNFYTLGGLASVAATGEDSFRVNFNYGALPTNNVKKIVIETQNDTFGLAQCLISGYCED